MRLPSNAMLYRSSGLLSDAMDTMSASVRRELDLIRLCRLLDGVRWSSEPSHTCLLSLANAKIRSPPRAPIPLQSQGGCCISRSPTCRKLRRRVGCIATRNVMKGSGCGLGWKRGGARRGPPKKHCQVHTCQVPGTSYLFDQRTSILSTADSAGDSRRGYHSYRLYTASKSCVV